MTASNVAGVALALGLFAASLVQTRLETGGVGTLTPGLVDKLVFGTIRNVSEKSFQLCGQNRCIRVLAHVPSDWKGHFAAVQGVLAENILLPKDNNAMDLTH